jgi:hypothetical protein
MPTPSSSFTIKSNGGILRSLISDIIVHIPGGPSGLTIKAIWDAGATGSVISQKVAKTLGLIVSGYAVVNTANGQATQKTYTVDVGLPNKVLIQNVLVTEVDSLTAGCDALIGMDIITLGDFSITNHKGITCMSFRFPSCHEIDYVTNPTFGITAFKNISPGLRGSNFTPSKKKRK